MQFEVGDIFDLSRLSFNANEIDLVTCMFVLHEFITDSEASKVVKILRNLREKFPRSLILICELCRSPIKRLHERPTGIAEHHLFHALSKQHIASLKQWRSIFRKSSLKLCEEYRFDPAEQGYFVLKNAIN